MSSHPAIRGKKSSKVSTRAYTFFSEDICAFFQHRGWNHQRQKEVRLMILSLNSCAVLWRRSSPDALLLFQVFVSVVHREPRVNSKVLTVCLAVLAVVLLVVDIGLGVYCKSLCVCVCLFARHHSADSNVAVWNNQHLVGLVSRTFPLLTISVSQKTLTDVDSVFCGFIV